MNNRNLINTIASALPIVAAQRQLYRAAASGRVPGLRRFARSRRSSSTGLWIFAGVAVAGIAAALLTPSSRKGIQGLFERTGGGIGKQVGKLLGEQAGAHPRKAAELAREAREFISSRETTA